MSLGGRLLSHSGDDEHLDISLGYPHNSRGSSKPAAASYGTGLNAADDDEEESSGACKRTWLWHLVFFCVGVGLTILIVYLVGKLRIRDDGGNPDPGWSASDYQENWQYYANLGARPITIEDNMRLSRLGSPVLSMDSNTVVFTRTQFDQTHQNRSATTLWYYTLPYVDGYQAMPLTRPIWGVHDSQPSFDQYSRTIFFLSNRQPGSDTPADLTQIFSIEVPFPSSIASQPLVVPVSYVAAAGAKLIKRAFGYNTEPEQQQESPAAKFARRVAADTPADASSRGASTPTLPDAAQSTYTAPLQLANYPVSVENLLVGSIDDPPPLTRGIFAFSVRVFPNSTMAETARRLQAKAEAGGNSHAYDKLFVRHWDEYMDGTRSHVHLMRFTSQLLASGYSGVSDISAPIDLMVGVDSDSPTRPDGSAATEWGFSRSGLNFAFTRRTYDPYSNVSWTTNLDIYTCSIPYTLGAFRVGPAVCATCDNQGADTSPTFSPFGDDHFLYLAQTTPGYESDRWRIFAYANATQPNIDLTPDWTHSVSSIAWTSAGQGLYVGLTENAREKIMLLDKSQIPNALGNFTMLLNQGSNGNIQVSGDDSFFVYTSSSFDAPASINVFYFNSTTYNTTVGDLTAGFNELALSRMQLAPTREYTYFCSNVVVNGTTVPQLCQAWFWLPVDFDETKTYPLAFLIHGGPQQAWESAWSYRWNPQIYAAAGYAVSMINFHGSGGWGQDFTDAIRGRYGSLPYTDLMLGLDFLLDPLQSPYAKNIDPNRVAALGASYGGYMVNWIAGHNAQQKHKFRALVTHDGMFDTRAFYYSTDELWFPEHDMPGLPWTDPVAFEQWNPATPALVAQWRTPHMIVHGGRDYRIDVTQGLSAFTALQRQGVPSRFLFFPDEAHQIFNPKNVIEWHSQVFDWIGKWTAADEEPQHNEL